MPPTPIVRSKRYRQLRQSIIILLCCAAISIIGFMVLGWAKGQPRPLLEALYITANIFTTVGDIHWQPTVPEKVWGVLTMVFGVTAALYALGNVTAVLTSGEINRVFGRRQLADKIRSLKGHYIVCGFGRMGQAVCRSLYNDGVSFVVIDRDPEQTAAADEADFLYLLGDASDETILRLAGIDRSNGLVTCLTHDADNVFVTLTARGMKQDLTIIACAETEATERRLLRAGADRAICLPIIGALKVSRMLLRPAMEDLLAATREHDIAVDRLSVSEMQGLIGQSLRDLALPRTHGVMVLAVDSVNGDRQFNPSADHTLEAGEQLIVVGPGDALAQLESAYPPQG